ncbi:MAG: glycosyl hydrolase family 28-related protein [Bacteroidota bacterium]|nr:glycosyl hydrolase family 28-related protein [Bacteroidota bacterium]
MIALTTALLLVGLSAPADTLVSTAAEFHDAVRAARPGDTIVMVNGIWKDVVLTFDADGLEGDSITVRAESAGRVILTGSSRLRMGGRYLKVEGLWFHRGALSGGHVVQFRTDRPAHHSRLTDCAITEYNPANWLLQYKWVSLYGTHNRVDHCYFAGKTHDGATLVVWLEDPPNDQPNYHRIDHNFFGWRPVLGKNGGETIRIGTSSRSMQDSFTAVEFNLFHRTNGEHEIISNKSGHNTFQYNTFHEARGALTLRHGNHAVIRQNYFLGGGQPGTGGVRVIGEDHEVSHNYFAHLQGDSSRASLSVMNGIPDSPLNRYFQVRRAVIANNTFIDTHTTILYGLGADQEKTLLPEQVLFARNLVATSSVRPVVSDHVPTDQVSWLGNLFYGSSLGIEQRAGILWESPDLVRDPHDLLQPSGIGQGARLEFPPLTPADVGVSWWGQPWTPTVLADTSGVLPDFSYAGYRWGEREPPDLPVTFRVTDFGATGQDMNDDTRGFQAALDAAHARTGPVVIGIPAGVFHLSGVLLLERDSLILRGSGTGATRLYIEKPLGAMDLPLALDHPADSVRGHAVSPFTQAGGIIWSRNPDAIEVPPAVAVRSLEPGGHWMRVSDPSFVDVPGAAHLVSGQKVLLHVSVISRSDDTLYTKQPLPTDLSHAADLRLVPADYIREVGIEQLTLEFEPVPYSGHRLEDGYNAIYLTQVRHGWVRDVVIINADAGIILDQSANVTINRVRISGRENHIGLQLTDTGSALARDFEVRSNAVHPVGLQGTSSYNVIHRSSFDHLFDLTAGYPNLFDNSLMEPADDRHPLWISDTATALILWHLEYRPQESFRLPAFGGELGPRAIAVGLSSTVPIRVQLHPKTFTEGFNRPGLTTPSLYLEQLQQRLAPHQ